jgi:two-component system chemotaxis response regulator CheY
LTEHAKKRVLVVDDASLTRLYYRDALERAGYEVDEAMNGIEALERLLMKSADLLIVDINMPQMDGLSFLKILRQQDTAVASTVALVTSTESSEQDFLAARVAGANFYLVKPIAQDVLVDYVAHLSGRLP